MNNQPSIAIIGAGPAGVHCAGGLLARGFDAEQIRIFEKSRGIGGRLASRRRPGFEWHHGAGVAHLASGQACSARTFRNGLKAAASSLPISFGAELQRIKVGAESRRYTLKFNQGPEFGCDVLLLCIPAPQATTLLAVSGMVPLGGLSDARFEPRWSLLLGLKRPLRVDPDLMTPLTDLHLEADRRSLVLHADAAWSAAHLELPRQQAAQRLLSLTPQAIKRCGVLRVMAHRWRYALAAEPAAQSCLWDTDRQLGAAGDWCLGSTVGAAIDSGVALARQVQTGHQTTSA